MQRSGAAVLGLFLLISAATAEPQAAITHKIEGRLLWPEDVTSPAKMKLVVSLDNGRRIYGWPRADGSFVLNEIPEGTHLLDVVAIGLVYPQIRLEVNGAFHGRALATYAENRSKIIPAPLLLKPIALAEYFEKREPFNLIGFLKTPYGMMAAFGIFAVFILPKLRVDPEEYKEATEALTGEGASASPQQPSQQVRRRN